MSKMMMKIYQFIKIMKIIIINLNKNEIKQKKEISNQENEELQFKFTRISNTISFQMKKNFN